MLFKVYIHTLPLVVHDILTSDHTFQATNQPSKPSISKDTGSRSHTSVVPNLIMKDLVSRIHEMVQLISVDVNDLRTHAAQILKRLLFGKVSDDHPEDILESNSPFEGIFYQLV